MPTEVKLLKAGKLAVHGESLTLKYPPYPRKVDIRLPGKRNSNCHGARPVY